MQHSLYGENMKKFAFLLIASFALFQAPQTIALPFEDSLNEYQKLIEEIRSKFAEKFPENERIINIYRDTQKSLDEPNTVLYFITTFVGKEDSGFPAHLDSEEFIQNNRIYIAHLRIMPNSSDEPTPIEVVHLVSLSDSMQIENNP